ncbi:MAG: hypothetical protein QXX41_01210 [Nitrososphaerota archaeon]
MSKDAEDLCLLLQGPVLTGLRTLSKKVSGFRTNFLSRSIYCDYLFDYLVKRLSSLPKFYNCFPFEKVQGLSYILIGLGLGLKDLPKRDSLTGASHALRSMLITRGAEW